MKKLFPKQIVVTIEEKDTEDEYLMINKSAEEAAKIGEVRHAAIYVLKEQVDIRSVVSTTPI